MTLLLFSYCAWLLINAYLILTYIFIYLIIPFRPLEIILVQQH